MKTSVIFTIIFFWWNISCFTITAQEIPIPDEVRLKQAEMMADRFVERFRKTLDFGIVWNEFKASNVKCTYEASGFFSQSELERLKFDTHLLERLYVSSKDHYYLYGAYQFTLAYMNDDSSVMKAIRRIPKDIRLAEKQLEGSDEKLRTARDIEQLIRRINKLTKLLRKHMPENVMKSKAWRANNNYLVNRGGGIVHRGVLQGNSTFCVPDGVKVYIIDRGLFYFYFVEVNEEMKVVGLGELDSV